jgi:hypothetical protein
LARETESGGQEGGEDQQGGGGTTEAPYRPVWDQSNAGERTASQSPGGDDGAYLVAPDSMCDGRPASLRYRQ